MPGLKPNPRLETFGLGFGRERGDDRWFAITSKIAAGNADLGNCGIAREQAAEILRVARDQVRRAKARHKRTRGEMFTATADFVRETTRDAATHLRVARDVANLVGVTCPSGTPFIRGFR
jgi:hypothetical protein